MEVIESLVESVNAVLKDAELSLKVVRRLCKDFGGEQVYIPQERTAFKADIYDEIYEEYRNTADVKALARKWNTTSSNIYKITKEVAKARREAKKPVQGMLFSPTEEFTAEEQESACGVFLNSS